MEDLEDDGELQGLFAAYFCPANQISDERHIAIDNIEGWGVPKTAPKRLRDLFSKMPKSANENADDGRRALYSIFAEADAWRDFIDDYEDTMLNYRHGLILTTLIATTLAVVSLYFSPYLSILILGRAIVCWCCWKFC